jgi:hypothetical protein
MRKTLLLMAVLLAACTRPSAPTYSRGDVNGDGHVNINDLNAMKACMGLSASTNATCKRADLDDSGMVTSTDFAILRSLIGGGT